MFILHDLFYICKKNTMFSKRITENQILVIFGSNGDLAKRKLLPAIYQLFLDKQLPADFAVVGSGSQEQTVEAFRAGIKSALHEFAGVNDENPDFLNEFLGLLYYQQVNNKVESDFYALKKFLNKLSVEKNIPGNIIFYFSIPPFMYETVAENLVKSGLNVQEDGWKRIIIEKPFGYSYESAIELDLKLHKGFLEEQIYRIDHYLGKETVQNIIVTRFYNGFFEPIWNRKYIDRVEITAAEKIGVGNRGGYYDTSGALRDMIQNHLLQVLAVVAMEPPAIFDSDSIRNETVKVLQALRPIKASEVPEYVIRGQYTKSVTENIASRAYLEENGVSQDSKTETFVAIKAFIDNWRWGDVPFYIRTGKNMPERVTEVVIHLKHAPHQLFKQLCLTQPNNMIILRIHPDAGVAIDFGAKIPGAGYKVHNVNMAFRYADLSDSKIPEAYERLLLDCMTGDSTLYARADAVKASWKFVDPILNAWKENSDIPLYPYSSGSWGPEESNLLFNENYIRWREPGESIKKD